MNVKWSGSAIADLDDIERFIALDDPERAAAFIMELIDLGESLALKETAGKGTSAKWTDDKNIRELYYGNYTIIYEILKNEVMIHEVHNNARMLKHFKH